ncbi:MAG: lysophospholipid acyltransferase family protein [Syntrophales bacterium]
MNNAGAGDTGRTAVAPGRNRLRDFAVTVILWAYYIMGFILFFSPFYLHALFFPARREEAFQRLNHRLHKSFFAHLRTLAPRVQWRIADEVKNIRSSVIIANHLSFLDPILFVSLFERQKTIVKNDYFSLPVFGGILRTSGYIPSQAEGLFAADMVDQIKRMQEYLAGGGNLFIFPEGHRSRDGRIGPFDQGAFKIARLCRASSIKVVVIRNTGRLFPPGSFLFNTHDETVIEVELAGSLDPDYESEAFSLTALMAQARRLMEKRMYEGQPHLHAGCDPSTGAASRKVGLDMDDDNDYKPPVNGSSEYPLR